MSEKRKLVGTVVGWLLLGGLSCAYGTEFLWYLYAPVYLLVLAIKLLLCAFPSMRRKASLRRMWVGPVVLLVLLPFYHYRDAAVRSNADRVASAVEAYHQLHGVYPPDSAAIGLGRDALRKSFMGYALLDKGPFLYYQSAFCVFDLYVYQFDRHA